MSAKPLFDDEGEEEVQLKVNEGFAKRFEHNKKREELQRLQEKYPEQTAKLNRQAARQAGGAAKRVGAAGGGAGEEGGSDEDSSSEDEDEDAERIISEKTQAQIFETLLKIRRRDQSIYQPDAKFYSSGESEGEDEDGEGAKKRKVKKERPMYLKDVMYQQAVEGTAAESSDDEAAAAEQWRQGQGRSYAQEQEDLKKAFLSAYEENVEGGGAPGDAPGADGFGSGVLQQRRRQAAAAAAAAAKRGSGGGEEEGSESSEEEEEDGGGGGGQQGGASGRVQELLDGYFGRDDQLSADDRFLKRYILKKGWVEEGDDDFSEGEEGRGGAQVDDEEDEQFVEQAEQFEHAYNFRFEEPGGGTIVTHPRQIEGTVRKEDERRKRQRAEKAARKAAEEEQRRAEVKRLKNLKKAEIDEKLQEIQTVAGKAAPRQELLDALVGGDFDPEEYDKQMAAAFGDDYYDAGAGEEDDDDLEDELFEKELEAMAQYGSEDDDPQSFAALHKRLAAQRKGEAAADTESEEEEGEEEGAAAADPEAAARTRAEVQRLLEEYYKLDYEDVVGGVPTRFRYKEVAPDSFGLGVEDILALEDRELNQVVGLKTLAPYRDDYKKFRPNYQKINELRQQRAERAAEQAGQGQGGRHGGGAAGGKPWQPWQQEGQQGQQREWQERRPVKSKEERRLESFAKPTLKKGWQQQQQYGEQAGGRQQADGSGSGQKRKREQQHGGGGGDDAGQKPKQPIQPKQPKQSQPKQQQQQQQAAGDGVGLSKAAKKNMKRAEKRAAKRSKTE